MKVCEPVALLGMAREIPMISDSMEVDRNPSRLAGSGSARGDVNRYSRHWRHFCVHRYLGWSCQVRSRSILAGRTDRDIRPLLQQSLHTLQTPFFTRAMRLLFDAGAEMITSRHNQRNINLCLLRELRVRGVWPLQLITAPDIESMWLEGGTRPQPGASVLVRP